mmetsp:Transcript_1260/g.2945  ORF Transcript_1260/g.2945 Transcript_1260/m.2945 type:complete len:127 (+) Transcript_1260:571-951(+)
MGRYQRRKAPFLNVFSCVCICACVLYVCAHASLYVDILLRLQVACAVQNMHLVATAAGIAAYWSSGGVDKVLASEPVRSLLRLSDDERCLGLFHVGMSDRSDKYRGSRKPWQEKVTWLSGQSEQKQ